MYTEQIIFTRVFDVQHIRRGRNGPKGTLFGVEVKGKRHFSIIVNGWQDIAPNNVYAVFRTQDDWKTLIGWKYIETGAIVTTSMPTSRLFAYIASAIALCWIGFMATNWWWLSAPFPTVALLASLSSLLCIVALESVCAANRGHEERRALEALGRAGENAA